MKPRIAFTLLDNPELNAIITFLGKLLDGSRTENLCTLFSGGLIVDDVDLCTVLVTSNVKRSQKLLTSVGRGKPICSPDWLIESQKQNTFLGSF